MPLMFPLQSEEIKKINNDLREKELQYYEAVVNDSALSVIKDISLKITELTARLQHIKEVSLGLKDNRQ